ncbi:Heterogeneou nuclear ribonucleoprotein A1 [Taenia solium]|eukprot:TsM_000735000 transcript=TsM_000735000 gene=TsM_000735000
MQQHCLLFRGEDEQVKNKPKGSGCGGRGRVDDLCLLIGNMNPSTTQQMLEENFSQCGKVTSVDMFPGHECEWPRHLAVVNMVTPQAMDAVLEACPHQIYGKIFFVHRLSSRVVGRMLISLHKSTPYQLVVNGLPRQVSKMDIRMLFEKFGEIRKVKMAKKKSRACVTFSTAEALQKAVEAEPPCIKDLNIRVPHLIGCSICVILGKMSDIIPCPLLHTNRDSDYVAPITDICCSGRGNYGRDGMHKRRRERVNLVPLLHGTE